MEHTVKLQRVTKEVGVENAGTGRTQRLPEMAPSGESGLQQHRRRELLRSSPRLRLAGRKDRLPTCCREPQVFVGFSASFRGLFVTANASRDALSASKHP